MVARKYLKDTSVKMFGRNGTAFVGARPAGWTANSACLGEFQLFDLAASHTALFPRILERCLEFCDVCPVRQECLDEAMVTEADLGRSARIGVRGGLTPSERARHAAVHIA